MVKSILLLHLSDLHFGPNSRFAGSDPKDLSQKLCIAIDDECNRRKIDEKISFAIITGDIAENAKSEEYDLAKSFFENLAKKLNVDRKNFFFVPGNHDVNWIACKHVELDQEEQKFSDEDFATRINQTKFRNFEIFAKDFYGISLEEKGQSINYGSYIYNIDDARLSIAALNSSEKESHRKKDQIGFLSDGHAQSLMKEWYSNKYDCYLKIIIIHHNPIPTVPENVEQGIRYLENLDKEGRLKNLDVQRFASDAVGFNGHDKLRSISVQCQVQLILHGHHHVAEQNTWPWQRDGFTHILSAGSWGLKPDELPKDQDNNIQLILLKPEERKLHAWTLVYNPHAPIKGSVDRGAFTSDSSNPDGYHQPLFLPKCFKEEKIQRIETNSNSTKSIKTKRASFVFCLSIDLFISNKKESEGNASKLDRWYKFLVDKTKLYLEKLELGDSSIKFAGNCWQLLTDDPEKAPVLCCLATIMACNFQEELSKERSISKDKIPQLRLAICGGSDYSVELPDGRRDWVGSSTRNSIRALDCCYPNEILIDETVRSIISHDFHFNYANIESRPQEYQYAMKNEKFPLYILGALNRESAGESDAAGYFIYTMDTIGNKEAADYVFKSGEKSIIEDAKKPQENGDSLKILKKYNRLIFGLKDYAKISEMYEIGKKIGLGLNIFTYSILISKSPDYDEAKKWLEEMLEKGIEPDVVSYNTLIQKAPDNNEAKKWLDAMLEKGIEPDVVSYTTLIQKAPDYDEAKKWLDAMLEKGIEPDVFSYNTLIQKAPDYDEAKKRLEEMLEKGIEPDVVSYNTLIQKAPDYDEAKKWLEAMLEKGIEPDVFSYTTLIQKAPDYDEAKKWLEEMLEKGIEPDVVSYNTLIQKAPDYDEAKKWLEEMLEKGIEPDVFSYTTLIQKAPDYDEAKKWLEEMLEKGIEPNVVSYTILIQKAPDNNEAKKWLDAMLEKGIRPSVVSYTTLIQKAPDYDEAKKWLDEMLEKGIEPNVVSYNTLIQKAPDYDEAKKWLDAMLEKGIKPDVVSYTTLIQKAPDYDDAKKWLDAMLEKGIKPDVVSYNILIQKAFDYDEAKKWLEAMLEKGIKPNVFTYNILIQKAHDYNESKKWLGEMLEKGIRPSVVSYNTLIQKALDYGEAKKCIEEMHEKGIKPNVFSYTTLIQKTPDYDEAKKWLEAMLEKGIRPSVVSYNALIQKAPDYGEAKKWLEAMLGKRIRPDVVSFNALISGAPSMHEALFWLREMEEYGVEANNSTYEMLISKRL